MAKLLITNLSEVATALLPQAYGAAEIKYMQQELTTIMVNAQYNRPVTYDYAEKNRKSEASAGLPGRLYSCGSSMQGLKRTLRNVIADREATVDVDMVNAHPSILSQVSKQLGVSTPVLDKYVVSRNVMLAEIHAEYGVSGAEAKKIPLAIINGACRSRRYESIGWLKELEDEMALVYAAFRRTEVGERIVEHVNKVNKRNASGELIKENGWLLNMTGTSINLYLCVIENIILNKSVEYLVAKGIAVHTLCFDGLIAANSSLLDLAELSEYVRTTTGFDMKFQVKPFEDSVSAEIRDMLEQIDASAAKVPSGLGASIDFSREGITFVRACMGFGKTSQLFEHLKRQPDASVLFVAPRKTLVAEIVEKFGPLGFKHYQKGKSAFEASRLVCQIDSVWKIQRRYDVVVLDEVETNMHHLASFESMKNKEEVAYTIEKLIRDSKQTFILDANLTPETKSIVATRRRSGPNTKPSQTWSSRTPRSRASRAACRRASAARWRRMRTASSSWARSERARRSRAPSPQSSTLRTWPRTSRRRCPTAACYS
ncbi:unnamed protein product [Sphagnum jensenii]